MAVMDDRIGGLWLVYGIPGTGKTLIGGLWPYSCGVPWTPRLSNIRVFCCGVSAAGSRHGCVFPH